jgi:hypothetical protein
VAAAGAGTEAREDGGERTVTHGTHPATVA